MSVWCLNCCLYRITEVEPKLKKLNHYFQLGSVTGLKDQCFSFMVTLDGIVNMIRCVYCLKSKKKSLLVTCKSQEVLKEHCIVSINNVWRMCIQLLYLSLCIDCGRCYNLDFERNAWCKVY